MTALGENQAALNNSSRHNRQYFVEEVSSGESRPHDNPTFDQKSKKNRNIKMPCVYLKKNSSFILPKLLEVSDWFLFD